jgi:5'-3' exoribonuclease 2
VPVFAQPGAEDDLEVPGFGNTPNVDIMTTVSSQPSVPDESRSEAGGTGEAYSSSQGEIDMSHEDEAVEFLHGVKRKHEEMENAEDEPVEADEEEEAGRNSHALKVNTDGTVEQEDTVK